jgi:calcium/calmodulin-dependent protein kinase I
MPQRQSVRFYRLSTTFMRGMLCTEVRISLFYQVLMLIRCLDLKPENLLYLTRDPDSDLVLADFGIAKMLNSNEVLTTMAGSFGYAAPEVMEKRGHGKPVDMWSLGVITYTLLCGYSPFRSETMGDLIEECRNEKVIFHPRYWSDVSEDAKDFIRGLLKADPKKRPSSEVRICSR